ncbi:MAG: hypothetical protein JSS07_10710 [Proteobacteria bacterium]|nr:hypothetical protein [Pseudomonadota bacterium]
MLSYRSHSNGKLYQLKKGKFIGRGAYAKVGDIEGRPGFVYKEITLYPPAGSWVDISKDMRFKGMFRELWALKKLNHLEGYIRTENSIIIIMPKFKGTPEQMYDADNDDLDNNNEQDGPKEICYLADKDGRIVNFDENRALATYKALLALNYQGIFHPDPHPFNSLVYEENGKLKASLIDFGHAKPYSWHLNQMLQWHLFYENRPCEKSFFLKKEQAKKEFNDEHKWAYYATYGFYLIAGIGVVSLLGINTFVFWQFLRSYIASEVIIEARAYLDGYDIYYSKTMDVEMSIAEKRKHILYRMLVKLGYVLVNLYLLTNLYFSLSNIQLLSQIPKFIDSISRCDLTFASISNLLKQGILPALTSMVELIKNQNYAALDKPLAEILYLFKHSDLSARSFANLLERVPPVESLLVQADLVYQYNPTLLVTYAKTKAKELCWGPIEDPQLKNSKLAI